MTDRGHNLSKLTPTPSGISLIAYPGALRGIFSSQLQSSEKDGSPDNFTRRWSILLSSDLRRPHPCPRCGYPYSIYAKGHTRLVQHVVF
jgi:hypothetical protein